MIKRFNRQLCVVCSAGGHLSEALAAIRNADVDRCFVTKRDQHVAGRLGGYDVHYVVDPHTSVLMYMINVAQSLSIFIRERPRVILTTGAGIALAMCMLGKLFGTKIIFLESGARVTSLSRTGRFMYRLADVFYVQWENLVRDYPKAIFKGRLI